MASMQDVARRAKVSTATVSRVLSNPDTVREATRRKVMAAVEALDYRIDARARSLRKETPQVVVVIVNDLDNPFIIELIHGIEDAAQALGLSVLLGDSQRNPAREREYAELVTARQAQGIIQLSSRRLFDDRGRELSIPVVNALDCVENAPYPTVQIDNRRAAREATNHLIELGHRCIGAVTGPAVSTQSADRLEGFREALASAGLTSKAQLQQPGDYTAASGAQAAAKLCDLEPDMTAIFCFNDAMALGAVNTLVCRGLSVPQDMSVVGFDDVSLAQYFNPPLTTVRQPAIELGRTALDILSRIMTGEQVSRRRIYLDHALVVRHSTAPPPEGR